ncbi:MAG: diguanylate cyclase domain-containing protein [Betaproteobacteria bacterium]
MSALHINKKMNKLLITLYTLVVMSLLGSLGFAVHQNWLLKYKSTKIELARQAGIGNFIVENAISNATKSLSAAQKAMQPMLHKGLTAAQAQEILQNTFNKSNTYSNSTYEGLLLYIDAKGVLVTSSDQALHENINLADRPYFLRLSQNADIETTVSPLVKARTTGEWVFHVSISLKDNLGKFQGVLVQQIRADDIAKDLSKYINVSPSAQMVSQSPDSGLFFAYPLRLLSSTGLQHIATPYADFARRSISPQDTFTWPPSGNAQENLALVGYAHSEQSELMTTMEHPLKDIGFNFFMENLPLLSISGVALFLVTGIFLHLYRISNRLSAALHSAYFDALTKIPNRRAFNDLFPRLVRDAIRTQEPLSVLFIDVDHFKNFNEDYGHDGGDIALKAVAETLTTCAARPLDFTCRWGGEEFVAILPRTSASAAKLLAQKILTTVKNIPLQHNNGASMRNVSVSIGIASGPVKSKQQGEQMVREADACMLQAKHSGRNRYVAHQR